MLANSLLLKVWISKQEETMIWLSLSQMVWKLVIIASVPSLAPCRTNLFLCLSLVAVPKMIVFASKSLLQLAPFVHLMAHPL
jgi:hypothetical protein